jgi:hypothetical protein
VYGLQCDEIVIEEATFEEFCNPRNVESNPEVTFRGIQKSSGSHHVDFKNVDILRIFSPYVSTVRPFLTVRDLRTVFIYFLRKSTLTV